MNVAFPLRDGYFKPLKCTPDDTRRWKQLAVDLVARSLQEEKPYYHSSYTYVDTQRWKPYKAKNQLRVYQARRSFIGRSTGNAQTVLTVGTMEGTLEDVIYGSHHVTTKDMQVTTSYLSDDALDCAVLHVFENGTPQDPYRSLALKWRIIETPGGSLIVNRDGCVLEYMGIDYDSDGNKFAFHISENFDHPSCPPFHAKCAVRARAHTCVLYRQITPGRVGVYLKGEYSMGGKIPSSIARRTASEIALSIGKSVACAQAKKLTTLALQTSPIFATHYNHHGHGHGQSPLLNSTTGTTTSTTTGSTTSGGMDCSMCRTKPGYMSTKSMTWCKVCGKPVCSKCRAKKYLLSDFKKIKISCCTQCLVTAKKSSVDPTKPLQLISANGQWLTRSLLQSQAAGALERVGDSTSESSVFSQSQYRLGGWDTSSTGALSVTSSFASSTFDGDTGESSVYNFDDLLTPMSSISDNEEDLGASSSSRRGGYSYNCGSVGFDDDAVVLLEATDMPCVHEEDDQHIATLEDVAWRTQPLPSRRISVDDYEDQHDNNDAPPALFARSAFTPSVAKSDHPPLDAADRMSLFSQMQRLREKAEDVYSLTQAATQWELLGRKPSNSNASSSRSTAVLSSSTSSYSSSTHPITQ